MRVDLTGPWKELYERFREFGEKSLSTDVVERDRTGTFAEDDWRLCAEQGVQGLMLPAAYGGADADAAAYARAMEGLGYGCLDNGLLMALGAHILAVQLPILEFGDDDQRRRYLPELASGRLIGANAMSEPGSGSDAMALACTAERDGDGYRLTGNKRYVTNAPTAGAFLVYATIDSRLGFTGVTAFLVERDDPGLSVRDGSERMGLRTAPWGELEFDGCRIPATRRLGAEKQGSRIFARTMAWERTLLLAPWLGVMQREIERCVDFSRRRRQFGRHIGHYQSVSNRLVDTWIRYEASRMFIYRATDHLSAGGAGPLPEAAKLFAGDAVVQTFQDLLQVYGALGYTKQGRVERHVRDALGMSLSSGTADLQRLVIADGLGITQPHRFTPGGTP
jgi:alkylation response protein AidB-like acyl-CoA dehydrogenase